MWWGGEATLRCAKAHSPHHIRGHSAPNIQWVPSTHARPRGHALGLASEPILSLPKLPSLKHVAGPTNACKAWICYESHRYMKDRS